MKAHFLTVTTLIWISILLTACTKKMITYQSNPSLKSIKSNYQGNVLRGKQFVNYQDVPLASFGTLLKWRFSKNPQKHEKKNEGWLPKVIPNDTMFTNGRDKIVWLGHASFLITLNGKNLLIDPVFNDIPFVKRLIPIPFARESAKQIDYVLLSHGHFDHCDKKSLQTLQAQNPNMKILSSLYAQQVLKKIHPNMHVQEAGWYQQYEMDDAQIEIYYLPAFHWYKRGLRDNNTMLWGSFMIKYNGKTIYFMGDSGYNTHFKEIAELFPDIDYCMMGVGAYKPLYMMRNSHTSPQEAVQAFNDLKGKTFIPMHYGTFDLADEPLGEPLKILDSLNKTPTLNGKLKVLDVGEELYLTP